MKKNNYLLITSALLFLGLLLSQTLKAQIQVDTFNTTINFGGNPNWILSCYVPPGYKPVNKYKLIIGLHGIATEPGAAEGMRDFFVQNSAYPSDSPGLVTNPRSPVDNAIVICPYLYGVNTDLWTPVGDTALITRIISYADSIYNIDPHYIYLSGFSYGGRGSLRYGLLNYWRFRGLVLFTPAVQTIAEANNLTSFQYVWQNGKYIPIYISVGAEDGYAPIVSLAYQYLCDSGAIATLQIIYGMTHSWGPNPNTFFAFNYVDSLATSYATNDAGISNISNPIGDICSTSLTPEVTIQNKGVGSLTSAIINYQIDNGTINTYNWSGNLIQLGIDKVTLPSQTISVGAHTFKAYTTMPNGVADNVPSNDTMAESFNCMTNGTDTLTEGFESTVFPPIGWQETGTDDAWSWARLSNGDTAEFSFYTIFYPDTTFLWGAYGQSASCIYFNNYVPNYSTDVQYYAGEKHSLITPACDFTNSSSPTLSYDYAYGPFDAMFSDTLAVNYSIDCGNTWDTLLVKGGLGLSTIEGYDSSSWFIPTSTQWQHQTIELSNSPVVGQPEVLFSFEMRSGGGNLFFLDNISIDAITGIANEMKEKDSLNVYPNPSSGNINVSFNLNSATNVVIKIYDIQGQLVYSEEKNQCEGNYQTSIDLSNQAKGVYLLNIITDTGTQNKEIILQ